MHGAEHVRRSAEQDLHLQADLHWIDRFSRADAVRDILSSAKRDPLKRIRVLLAKMPALMLDIIHHVVAAEPDMAVVSVVDDGDLPAAVRRSRADVLVVGQDAQAERDSYLPLLLRQPHVKVLAIADNGRSGSLYELRPRRVSLGKISARTLTQAIRGGTQPTSKTGGPRRRSAEVH